MVARAGSNEVISIEEDAPSLMVVATVSQVTSVSTKLVWPCASLLVHELQEQQPNAQFLPRYTMEDFRNCGNPCQQDESQHGPHQPECQADLSDSSHDVYSCHGELFAVGKTADSILTCSRRFHPTLGLPMPNMKHPLYRPPERRRSVDWREHVR